MDQTKTLLNLIDATSQLLILCRAFT